MTKPMHYAALLGLCLCLYLAGIAFSFNNDAMADQRKFQSAVSARIDLPEAVARVNQGYPGFKIIFVNLENKAGQTDYLFELLGSQGAKKLTVDAKTGAVVAG